MIVLVIGGSGSGKSEYAESLCMKLHTGPKLYVATMEPYGEEGKTRIARHHRLRHGKGFETLECYTHLENAEIPAEGTVLLECMSNLIANEMFSPEGRKQPVCPVIMNGIRRLISLAEHVVIVTNQVFSDGVSFPSETESYVVALAEVNEKIAQIADEVVEVVHGIPVFLKRASSVSEWGENSNI